MRNAPSLPAVTPPASGIPASVQQARFGVRRAQITQAQVSWDALPNVQASYTHYPSDTAGVGVALDSRNLSPAVNFSYAPRTPPLNRVRDQFSLGVSFDASASSLSAPGLAQNAVDQAQAGLETARRQAELQLAGLNAAYAQAQRQRALAQQALTWPSSSSETPPPARTSASARRWKSPRPARRLTRLRSRSVRRNSMKPTPP